MKQLPKVRLASKSPRRHALLKLAHIEYEVALLDVDESYPADMPIAEVPEYLARIKARAAAPLFPNEIVLAADCVVIHNDQILGKPQSAQDAIATITQLAGSRHSVVTGVCLKQGQQEIAFSDSTLVELETMSLAEIEWYVSNYEPFDKAGSYGIQDWIGHCKVRRIEGSYNNVMGLPTHKVYQALRDFKPS